MPALLGGGGVGLLHHKCVLRCSILWSSGFVVIHFNHKFKSCFILNIVFSIFFYKTIKTVVTIQNIH